VIEPARGQLADLAKHGLYAELDRAKLADDLLKGVSFEAADATAYARLDYSHVYVFDRVFSRVTLIALAKVRCHHIASRHHIACSLADHITRHCTSRSPADHITSHAIARRARLPMSMPDVDVRDADVRVPRADAMARRGVCGVTWQVLQRSSFYVMISSHKPRVWWECGLTKIQPVAKTRCVTTGRERMTFFIYINSHFIPCLGT
jgi:hypothetical protein